MALTVLEKSPHLIDLTKGNLKLSKCRDLVYPKIIRQSYDSTRRKQLKMALTVLENDPLKNSRLYVYAFGRL